MQDPISDEELDADEDLELNEEFDNDGESSNNVISEIFEDSDSESNLEPEPVVESEIRQSKTEPSQTLKIEVAQSPAPRKRGRPKKKTSEEIESEDFVSMMEAFDPESTGIWFELRRVEPMNFMGKSCGGYIARLSESFTTEDVKQLHGGGKYQIVVHGPRKDKDGNPTGSQKIITRKTFRIAGDPIIVGNDSHSKPESDADITGQNLSHSAKLVDIAQADKREEAKRADRLLELAMAKKNDGGSNKEMMDLLATILQGTQESSRRIEEDRRRSDDKHTAEMKYIQERHDAEMKEFRRDSEKKSESAMTPLIEMMKMGREDDKKSSADMLSMVTTMSNNNLQMMVENSKAQTASSQEATKMQITLLTDQLKRTADELKDTRIANKGDMVSEIKKYKTMKDLFEGESSNDTSLSGRLLNNLPELVEAIPSLADGFGSLFSKGKPVSKAQVPIRPRHRPALPAAPVVQPKQPETPMVHPADPRPQIHQNQPQNQPVNRPQNQMQSEQALEESNITQLMQSMVLDANQAMNDELDPVEFTNSKIIGLHDEELLIKIASLSTPTVVNYIQGFIGDSESLLTTVAGRDFLRVVHETIRAKYSE